MRQSSFFGVLCCGLLLFLLLAASVCTVEAKECTVKKGMRAWKYDGGSFLRDGQSITWHEMDKKGVRLASFTEVTRQEGQVLLHDAKRNMDLLLRSDLCAVRHSGEENFRQLYAGKFMKTVDCT
ncbi:hypothetical protein TraAM80_02722 [Trypanosoma rangeli]|uniref:Uncharacterized protein n=1 Tax=Trypanosoma rangeli TaxID=5698 RepID=A0A3R7KIY1_TRYRA|nr:uncharacterized protein TraAM80_02722 [Trypanosoma rangeli]RNF08496.1 hypothetical protein TraAM80_02722 [Trypanosoma rangeli]|eukprot:RNF08496.1 hypothetical protein TraAM80_02722 [Trypanosoma rangeli]